MVSTIRMRPVPILLALFLAAACGGRETPDSVFRIAVLPKGTSHAFWRAVHCGVARADAAFEDVEVVWKAPLGENGTAQQIELFESFVADGYQGVCVAPLDSQALAGAVKHGIERGVSVLVFDSPLANSELPIVSTVATDNRRGGALAGAEIARRLGGSGDVVLVRYMAGSCSTNLREEGCLEELAKHPDIHVISSNVFAGPDEATAVQVSERLLESLGESVRAVFCSNESTTSGFLTALKRDARVSSRALQVVGFDTSKHIVDALRAGTLAATVVQDPTQMGYAAVETMRAHLRGETTAHFVQTGEALITRESMDDPALRQLLELPEAVR